MRHKDDEYCIHQSLTLSKKYQIILFHFILFDTYNFKLLYFILFYEIILLQLFSFYSI